MRNAFTTFYINTDVKIKTLFPWAADVSVDYVTGESRMELNLSALSSDALKIRYSGINGY